MGSESSVNWLRVTMMVLTILLTIPATIVFGIGGLLVGLVFLVLLALAK